MTDLERLELILRRVLDHANRQSHESSAEHLLWAVIEGLSKENENLAKVATPKNVLLSRK